MDFHLPEIGENDVRKGGNGSWWSCGDEALTLIRRAVKRISAVSDSSLWPGIPGVNCLCGRAAVLGVALCTRLQYLRSIITCFYCELIKCKFIHYPTIGDYSVIFKGFDVWLDASILCSRGPNAGKTRHIPRQQHSTETFRLTYTMNFELPEDLKAHLQSIDSFIESKILPLQHSEDNNRFFDHRREHARTNWDQDGNPRPEWEELLSE